MGCIQNMQPIVLLLTNLIADTNAISSVYFNKFYRYLNDLLYFQYSSTNLAITEKEITQYNIINLINEQDNNLVFEDVKLAKTMGIDYSQLIFINHVIICAFMCIITSIGNKTLEFVDLYKTCKDNLSFVDKFYAMQTNVSLIKSVELNYNYLSNACVTIKNKILSLITNYSQQNLEEVISKIKDYSKRSNELMGYMYLYNVFNY